MKTGQKFKPGASFHTIELGTVMNTYAPFAKREPKGDGVGSIDTGYVLTNERQVRTTRAVTCHTGGVLSYRASDSYPILVEMGQVYINPAGTR